jgi:2-polyprenyl-3-methyl-5-hydroxy-6-metoxy-1,4-benzoquinol methylase
MSALSSDLQIVQKYFSVPYGDRVFVYTNIVKLKEIPKHTFLDLLSHKRAIGGKSVAMAIHEAIKKHYGSLSGKKVLDIGSSIGHFSFMMAGENAQVTGVECIEEKVRVANAIARIRGRTNVKFVKAFIENYVKTVKENFDLALMHNVFDYIPAEHNTEVLKRISQISKKLYSTVLIDPNFVLKNSTYTNTKKLLNKIYGLRDLWAFW